MADRSASTGPARRSTPGVAYLTEDRKHRGLLLGKGMRENLTLQSLADFTRQDHRPQGGRGGAR